jgi:hypothetical protein
MVAVASPDCGHQASRAIRSGTSQALPLGGALWRLVVREPPLLSRSSAPKDPLSLHAVLEWLAKRAVSPSRPPEAELSAPSTTVSSDPVHAVVAALGVAVAAVAVGEEVAGWVGVDELGVVVPPQALSATAGSSRRAKTARAMTEGRAVSGMAAILL